jgi:hypothetical protein
MSFTVNKDRRVIVFDNISNPNNKVFPYKNVILRIAGSKPAKIAAEYYLKATDTPHRGQRSGRIRYYTTIIGCVNQLEKQGFSINCSALANYLDI